jgi:hypothetical protein
VKTNVGDSPQRGESKGVRTTELKVLVVVVEIVNVKADIVDEMTKKMSKSNTPKKPCAIPRKDY